MTPGLALRAALGDMYEQSWRLFLLNAAVSAYVVTFAIAGLWIPAAWLLLIGAGPLAAALMHCSVLVATTGDLQLRAALTGLRLHWRRGLVLGAVFAALTVGGVHAISFYADRGALVLAVFGVYLLFALSLIQLVLWPLAVAENDRPLRRIAGEAGRIVLTRPLQALVLGVALVAVNVAGIAAALLPFLTLTVAYTFLAAAHFALPPRPLEADD
jgi:hypothetical protein